MQYIRQCLGRFQEKFISQRERYMHCIMTMICIFLLTVTFVFTMYASDALAQTFKDAYFYTGMASFMIVLVLIRKISFLNAPMLATIAVYAIASVKYFIDAMYEVELRNAMLAKCVTWGLLLIILVDVIRTGKRTSFNKENKVIPFIILIAFSCALALNFRYSLCMFCPFVALCLTPISKRQWSWLVDCLTVAYYVAFVCVMTKSLIEVPYTGDGVYYFGIFVTPFSIGIFCAGAFVCVLHWFVKFWITSKRDIVKISLCILAMVFPVYSTLIVYSRDAQLGVLGCALFTFIFVLSKRPNAWKKRGIGVLAVTVIAALCGILLLKFLAGIDEDSLKTVNEMLGKHFARWAGVARRVFPSNPTNNAYFQSPFLAALDMLLSVRPRIWVQALKNISLFGSHNMSVVIGDHDYGHPHNNYITWLLMYGWAGGVPLIIWFFSFFVRTIVGVLKKNYVYIFSFLWGAFMAFVMLFETVMWMYPATFLLLFAQYPLLIEQPDGGGESISNDCCFPFD